MSKYEKIAGYYYSINKKDVGLVYAVKAYKTIPNTKNLQNLVIYLCDLKLYKEILQIDVQEQAIELAINYLSEQLESLYTLFNELKHNISENNKLKIFDLMICNQIPNYAIEVYAEINVKTLYITDKITYCYIQTNQFSIPISIFENNYLKLIDNLPESYLINISYCYQNIDNTHKSINLLLYVINKFNSVTAKYNLLHILVFSTDNANIFSIVHKQMDNHKNDIDLILLLSKAYEKYTSWYKAANMLDNSLSIFVLRKAQLIRKYRCNTAAAKYLKKNVSIFNSDELLIELADIYSNEGKNNRAAAILLPKIKEKSTNITIVHNLCVYLLNLKKYYSVINIINKNFNDNPPLSILLLLGKANLHLRAYDKAEHFYNLILDNDQNNYDANFDLSNLNIAINKYFKALEHTEKCYDPLKVESVYMRGLALYLNGYIDESIRVLNTCQNLENNALLMHLYSKCLIDINKLDTAYEYAIKSYNCKDRNNIGIYNHLISLKLKIGDFNSDYVNFFSENLNPMTFIAISDDPSDILKNADAFYRPLNLQESYNKKKFIHSSKIKIAYISSDIRNHPVGNLLINFFKYHDGSIFEVYILINCPEYKYDNITSTINEQVNYIYNIYNLNDYELADFINKLGINIIIDLNGYTKGNRIQAIELCKNQIRCSWLGYTGPISNKAIDYILADTYVVETYNRPYFPQGIIFLPNSYMIDSRFDSNKQNRKVNNHSNDIRIYKFICLSSSYKINSEVLNAWVKILMACQNSTLTLANHSIHFRDNLLSFFSFSGITSNRIIFLDRVPSQQEHLERLYDFDLALDTWPYNGHSTTLDCLAASVPTLTLSGRSFTSRVTGSINTWSNLKAMITHTVSDYIESAIKFYNNKEYLSDIKNNISKNELTVFDTSLMVKNIEVALLKSIKSNLINDIFID